MIDPRTVMVAIPCADGRLMAETAGSLQQCAGLYAAVSMPAECSHVSLIRNLIAGQFKASPFEWLVCIDYDIAFSRRDFELLLEPCAQGVSYLEDASETSLDIHAYRTDAASDAARRPRPSRTLTALSVDPARGYDVKMGAAADLLVVAEYPYKNDLQEPVKLGMGFVRIHRDVFESLDNLVHDGGPTVEVQRHVLEELRSASEEHASIGVQSGDPNYGMTPKSRPVSEIIRQLLATKDDKAGQSRLWQCAHKGRMYTDYYPSGPILSQFVPTAEWKGEDHGFFTLCMLAGIVPRIETRTRLTHIGRKAYQYQGPDQGGGQ